MVRIRGTITAVALAGAVTVTPSAAAADAVDDAFARGNRAARAGDWDQAIAAYREASSLLPQRSALLSYNLGTAYAQRGELGRATYHLERAMSFAGGTTTDILENARYNAAIVRRRVETLAASEDRVVDSPKVWWDIIVVVKAPWLAWLSLVSGWALLATLAVSRLRPLQNAKQRTKTALWTTMLVLGLLFVVPGALHGLGLWAERTAAEAIVLRQAVEAREGPGTHRERVFTLQGGARVRVLDRAPGWREIRLPGGLSGWVREDTIARLSTNAGSGRQRASTDHQQTTRVAAGSNESP